VAGVARRKTDGTSPRPQRAAQARRPRAAKYQLQLLGGFAARRAGEKVTLSKGARRLVAVAALHHGPIPRRRTAERLWPQLEPTSADGSLRKALSDANKRHPGLLVRGTDSIALGPTVDVDVHEVAAFARALIAAPVPETSTEESIRRLTMSVLPDADEDWLHLERARLRDLFLHALEVHAARLAAAGAYATALEAIHAALVADPVRETAAQTLIEIHIAEGNRPLAARTYLDFRQRLLATIDAEPADELRALVAPYLPRR